MTSAEYIKNTKCIKLDIDNLRCLPRKRVFYHSYMSKEIKSWNEWKECIGNLIAYNDICQKEKLQIYFFGNHTNKETIINIIKHCKYKIEVFEIIDYLKKLEIKDLRTDRIINSISILENLNVSS